MLQYTRLVARAAAACAACLPCTLARAQWTNLPPNAFYANSGSVGIGASGGSLFGKLSVEGAGSGGIGVWTRSNAPGGAGLYAESLAVNGAGVVGFAASSASTQAIGVWGISVSPTGVGVAGEARATSGTTIGVYARAVSPQGFAGYFATGKTFFEGAVGIGTTNPVTSLDVNGSTRTRTIQLTGGSDLAEPFDVAPVAQRPGRPATAPEPGMVVVIDPDRPGKLIIADRPYDRRVAGVISGAGGLNPGVVLADEGSDMADGEHPVALVGRVWVWCDAGVSGSSGGPIEPGDRLTTASTPGHAMKVGDEPRAPGAVLGKAMTRLESGRGLVLVLINLQ
jgi:hypothetical protein